MQFYLGPDPTTVEINSIFPLPSMKVEAAYLKTSSDPAIGASNFKIFINVNAK